MRAVGRIGLAVVHPSWALALAGDRRHAGRAGSDLIVALLLTIAVTQLRGLVGARSLRRHAVVDTVFLAEPDQEAGVAQELEMSRDARLALRQHLADLAYSQLPFRTHGENSQARRLGGGAEASDGLVELGHDWCLKI